MLPSTFRSLALGALGMAVLAGASGCNCTGVSSNGNRQARAPKSQPLMNNQEIIMERLDMMQMNMDSRMSSMESSIGYMRDQQVALASRPEPVPVYPQPVADPYPYPQPLQTLDLPPIQPPVVRSTPVTSRQSLAAQHLRVPGVSVRELQQRLDMAAFSPGKIDGVMGKATIAAITAFQQSYGLKADGICGKETWGLLSNITSGAMPLPPK